MSKLNPMITGSSAAITFAIIYSVCALAVVLFPGGTIPLAASIGRARARME